MRTLTSNDYKLFQQITSLNQGMMLKTMETFLKKHYREVFMTKEYLIATGDIPVALAAHVDTVFKSPPTDVFYDKDKNVIWSPQGLGADDRAGIFAIIKLIRKGFKPHIILTTDEELGAQGARALVRDFREPFADIKYIIQLDRRGTNDCVFYDCDHRAFTDYVESFGFSEAIGSFTDISIICPKWKIAGVNLSIGYMDEHSTSETFYVTPFLATIDRVVKMLEDINNIEVFAYIPQKYSYSWTTLMDMTTSYESINCSNCHREYSDYEMFPVKSLAGPTKFFCPDCVVEYGQWCDKCGEVFEIESGSSEKLCRDCRGKDNNGKN